MLQCRDIQLSIDGQSILKGISVRIEDGEWVSLVGASGSGKSTLVKVLSGLQAFTSGSIMYQDEQERLDIRTADPIHWRQTLGYCHQLPYLFGKTVRDNLEFPFVIRKKAVDEDRIIGLLGQVGLDATYLDKSNTELSGGQMQRICLVRSLIFSPKVLLVDEVTSALDLDNTRIVERLLQACNQEGMTIVQITHNEEQSLQGPHRRITIDGGVITREEVLR